MPAQTLDQIIEQCRKVAEDRINGALTEPLKQIEALRFKGDDKATPTIYVLYDYDEYGAGDGLVATTDPAALAATLAKLTRPEWFDEELARLHTAVKDGTPGRHDLSKGWGGRVLHIC
jgi:hypothetical protein